MIKVLSEVRERENNTLLNRHVDPEESSCHYNLTCNCVFEEFIKLTPSLNATDTPRKRKDIFQGVLAGSLGFRDRREALEER